MIVVQIIREIVTLSMVTLGIMQAYKRTYLIEPRWRFIFIVGAFMCFLKIGPTQAQQEKIAPTPTDNTRPGMSRIQGKPSVPEPPPPPTRSEIFLDLREEMRQFVISIAEFGRQYRQDFRIIARGGLELLIKRDVMDFKRTSPARTYIRSLDGLVAEGIFSKVLRPGIPQSSAIRETKLKLVKHAKRNGVRIFTLDYGKAKKFIDQTHLQAQKYGFVPMVSSEPLLDISDLPAYPKRPFRENPDNVITPKQVLNFVAITNSIAFGRQDVFALKLHDTNYDMVIVDVFHGRQPLSRQAVETLKYKKVGAKRLVIAQMNIGLADSYKYYWEDNWGEGSPPFVNAPLRNEPDRYYVKYWLPQWQHLIAGDTNSFLYGIIRQGFDGVLIDGLETFRFFESGEEQ